MNAQHPRATIAPALLLLSASVAACSSGEPGARSEESTAAWQERLGQVSSPVIKGKDSDKSQDAVVLVIHYDPAKRDFGSCTGTLLNERLVLTARHCVAETDESAACDVKGVPLALGEIRSNHKADTLYIFTGTQRPDFRTGDVTPDGEGLKIIDDGGKNLCNHDIALIVLKDPVKNAKIAPIRLDDPIKKGETVTVIGWGVTDVTSQPDVRQQRTGIKVMEIGPDDTSQLAVPPNEFSVGESICSGDSGGPALASTGAIIGIVSRGGNATRPDPRNPASSCINGENLYTKVSSFKPLIMQAFEAVGAEPWLENGPDPRLAKAGAACTGAAECQSNLCLPDPTTKAPVCVEGCPAGECSTGLLCMLEGETRVCRPPAPPAPAKTTTTTSCAAAASHSADSGNFGTRALGFVLAVLGLASLRRRSRSA